MAPDSLGPTRVLLDHQHEEGHQEPWGHEPWELAGTLLKEECTKTLGNL